MKTAILRASAALCCVALVATLVSGCASTSRRKLTREEAMRATLDEGLGFQGRLLINDLGQAGPIRLKVDQCRIEGDHMYLVDVHNRLHVLNRGNLLSAWAYHGIEEPLRYPPSVSAVSLVGMSGNQLHQVDLRFGHSQGPPVHFDMTPSAPFVASAGTAYIPSWGGSRGQKTLRTLNLATGLEGWGYRTTGDIRGAMAIGGLPPRQTVYFATDSGDVYALPANEADAGAPDPVWVQNTHGAVTAGLVVDGDHLFVSSQDSFLYCMDRVTGGIRWSAPHPSGLTASAVATAGSVYQFNAGALYCHDRATGAERWALPGAVRFVVEREGRAVVQAANGDLWSVDADGKVVMKTSGGRYSYVTNTANGTLFAIATDGYIAALEVGGE